MTFKISVRNIQTFEVTTPKCVKNEIPDFEMTMFSDIKQYHRKFAGDSYNVFIVCVIPSFDTNTVA